MIMFFVCGSQLCSHSCSVNICQKCYTDNFADDQCLSSTVMTNSWKNNQITRPVPERKKKSTSDYKGKHLCSAQGGVP